MHKRHLQIDDRVELRDSTIYANGVIIDDLGPDYVRVKWDNAGGTTTHRRHSLELDRYIDRTERKMVA